MSTHQLTRDGKAETGSAEPRRAGERLEEVVARLGWQTGPVIGDLDRDDALA
jgi:hypothetical protein